MTLMSKHFIFFNHGSDLTEFGIADFAVESQIMDCAIFLRFLFFFLFFFLLLFFYFCPVY